jgi:radical SAM protein with 4Fe4S-binding SPASM domain
MSAFARADLSQELTTEECRRVIGEIAQVNPHVFLILTGGEPLLRADLFDIAAAAADRGFTVVLGSNGVLLRQREARLMRRHGIQGASISLDSTDPAKHDAFRHLPGAHRAAIRATEALRAEGLDFAIHASVMSWNVAEIPAMIELARSLGARVLNLFFLVRTGRGQALADITPDQCERLLVALARIQGVGDGGDQSKAPDSTADLPEDPWSVPAGRAGDLIVRAKCAPQFRRILYALDPTSPLLRNYAHGSCPAGRQYCRIMPDGVVTPCPYLPVSAGSLRQRSFAAIWETASILNELRDATLGGRCGACEFSRICGGCRCRAYAAFGDYLAEDPGCSYQPGQFGGQVIALPEELTFGLEVPFTMPWTEAAKDRLRRLPSFAWGMVIKSAERYAAEHGIAVITPETLRAARARAEARLGRRFTFTEFRRE